MALNLFFHHGELNNEQEIFLSEETARHVIQVLRYKNGDLLELTDGKGTLARAAIQNAGKKSCLVKIRKTDWFPPPAPKLHLGIAFTKNTSRNEWLLEKATELSVSGIIPLNTARSEPGRFRADRWNNILMAALIQSRQYHLPVLHEMLSLKQAVSGHKETVQKLIGHCTEEAGVERLPLPELMQKQKETIILIGPEGDFTKEEISFCLENGFRGVNLGHQRLRTETAALAACAYFNLINI